MPRAAAIAANVEWAYSESVMLDSVAISIALWLSARREKHRRRYQTLVGIRRRNNVRRWKTCKLE